MKTTKRKTLPFIFPSFFFSLQLNRTWLSSFSFAFVHELAYLLLQHWCTIITNDVALETMVFFSKRGWQSWGNIIFTTFYANTKSHLLTKNLEKHLCSQCAQFLQYLIHLSPSRHFSFLFMTHQSKSKILIQVLFNLILLHWVHAPVMEHY